MASRLWEAAIEPLDRCMPGFAAAMSDVPLSLGEAPGNPGIAMFREHGGPGLLVPKSYGGAELSAVDAVAVQRGIGALSPSTAVAVTMHQFTVATLVELVRSQGGMEWMMIEAIARQSLLMASGFAEGDPQGRVLRPTMKLEPADTGFRLTGEKVPCSLSSSMDLIAVSVLVPEEGVERFAVAMVSAKSPHGITVEPMWSSPLLAGAETGRVRFSEVQIPVAAVSYVGDTDELDETQVRGYTWFELLIAGSYLGVALALAEQVSRRRRGSPAGMTAIASELELCSAALASLAAQLDQGIGDQALLARVLLVRYAIERALQRTSDAAFEVLGVSALSESADAMLLLGSVRALSFHPPSRTRTEEALGSYVNGQPLVLE
jgi:alkylation response protein AidB-like acyl-CoA dehydrogenase